MNVYVCCFCGFTFGPAPGPQASMFLFVCSFVCSFVVCSFVSLFFCSFVCLFVCLFVLLLGRRRSCFLKVL